MPDNLSRSTKNNMSDIFYSIIIPHYNSLDTLPRTINSIPVRDDIEVLVIDNSPIPIKREQIEGVNRDFTLLYSDNTRGAGHARNVGLDNAKGKWLIFADSDDFFTEELNAVLDEYKDTDFDVVLFPNKTVDTNTLEPHNRESWFNRAVFNENLSDRQKLAWCITPWSKIVKHQLVKENNIRHGETPVSNDVVFNANVAISANSIKVDKEHIIYVLTHKEGSLITQTNNRLLYIRICVEIERNKIWKSYKTRELVGIIWPFDYIWKFTSMRYLLLASWKLLINGEILKDSVSSSITRVRRILSCAKKIVLHRY